MAFLKGFGKTPFWRDKLTSLVNDGRRMSTHLLTKKGGQDLRNIIIIVGSMYRSTQFNQLSGHWTLKCSKESAKSGSLSGGPICHTSEPQVATICLQGTRSISM